LLCSRETEGFVQESKAGAIRAYQCEPRGGVAEIFERRRENYP